MKGYRLSRIETLWMLAKPWLSLSVLFGLCSHSIFWLPVAIPLHFVTVVSTLHDIVHQNLRLSRRARDVGLFVYGGLMLQSGHSFCRTHLFHHRNFPSPEDIEGHPAFGSVWQALIDGPSYLPRLQRWTWKRYPRDRTWLVAETGHQILWLAIAYASWTVGVGLISLIPAALIVASWGLPLATARLQHDGSGSTPVEQTRTIKQPVLAWLLQGLGYHREHHANPGVPGMKLRAFTTGGQSS